MIPTDSPAYKEKNIGMFVLLCEHICSYFFPLLLSAYAMHVLLAKEIEFLKNNSPAHSLFPKQSLQPDEINPLSPRNCGH